MTAEVLTFPHAEQHGLTKYPQGSLRELWAISFPLMLSLMSSSLMFFWDRLLLAKHSIDALNAATNVSSTVAFLQFAFICTACIAEVFVGQYNGAGKKHKLGEPVWQMIWLSAFSVLAFIPMGYYLGDYIFQESRYNFLEVEYFQWLMFFGPIFCVNGALSSFYVGRGCVKFVTFIVIMANVVNTGLAYALIFGGEPFPAMGIAGAAVATGFAQTLQAVILFAAFLNKNNRQTYGTGNYAFNWDSFYNCIRVGFPNSLAHTIEIFAWVLFFRMMTEVSHAHITVVAIAQSIFFLFTFVTEGVSKGATAIAANLIGAKRWDLVWKLLRSGIKFYCVIFVVLGWFLVVHPEPLIQLFLPEGMSDDDRAIHDLISSACLWVWIFFLFDGITWLVVGLLTAAGDTKFVLKTGGTTVWLFALLPIYVCIIWLGYSPDMAWMITALYGFANCSIYLWRFQTERWKSISLAG